MTRYRLFRRPQQQEVYDVCRELGTPDAVECAAFSEATIAAFRSGFCGEHLLNRKAGRILQAGSILRAAYAAGMDCRKQGGPHE